VLKERYNQSKGKRNTVNVLRAQSEKKGPSNNLPVCLMRLSEIPQYPLPLGSVSWGRRRIPNKKTQKREQREIDHLSFKQPESAFSGILAL
jgi:hypothetical protein